MPGRWRIMRLSFFRQDRATMLARFGQMIDDAIDSLGRQTFAVMSGVAGLSARLAAAPVFGLIRFGPRRVRGRRQRGIGRIQFEPGLQFRELTLKLGEAFLQFGQAGLDVVSFMTHSIDRFPLKNERRLNGYDNVKRAVGWLKAQQASDGSITDHS